MSAPKMIRSMTSILRRLIRPKYCGVGENAAQGEVEAMAIDRIFARRLLSDMAGRQQLNQILIERMHSLPNASFNDAIQKLKFIFGDRLLRPPIDPQNFNARQAVAFDGRDEPLRDNRFEIARKKQADVRLLIARIIHPQSSDRLRSR